MIGYVNTRDGLDLNISGKSFYIKNTHPQFQAIKDALLNEDEETLLGLLDKRQRLIDFSQEELEVRGNALYLKGEALPDVLSTKILNLYDEGFPFKPFLRFYERLMNTPSNKVFKELLGYLDAGKWPILMDGRILAYKVVGPNPYKDKDLTVDEVLAIRSKQKPTRVNYGNTQEGFGDILRSRDYIDLFTRSVPQGVGDVLYVPRNGVDEDSNVTCSYGLHVAAYSYTNHYGSVSSGRDTVVQVAVCPSDWVSVPSDYNNTKARVCRYEVLGVHQEVTEKREALYVEREKVRAYREEQEELDDDDYGYDEEDDYGDEEGGDEEE